MALVPEPDVRNAVMPIFFEMMLREWENSNSFSKVCFKILFVPVMFLTNDCQRAIADLTCLSFRAKGNGQLTLDSRHWGPAPINGFKQAEMSVADSINLATAFSRPMFSFAVSCCRQNIYSQV